MNENALESDDNGFTQYGRCQLLKKLNVNRIECIHIERKRDIYRFSIFFHIPPPLPMYDNTYGSYLPFFYLFWFQECICVEKNADSGRVNTYLSFVFIFIKKYNKSADTYILFFLEWPTKEQIDANVYLKKLVEEFNSNDAQDIDLYYRIIDETRDMTKKQSENT